MPRMSMGISIPIWAETLLRKVRPHLGALVLAVAAGLLSGLPQHLAETSIGDDYHGVPFLFQDAELVYLTRIHEFQDGHPSVSSPFLHDYKDGSSSLMAPVGEYMYWVLSGYGTLSLSAEQTLRKCRCRKQVCIPGSSFSPCVCISTVSHSLR